MEGKLPQGLVPATGQVSGILLVQHSHWEQLLHALHVKAEDAEYRDPGSGVTAPLPC